jgi:hypothetical protein
MKVRIETYKPGPTEVRIKNLNSSVQAPSLLPTKELTDKPGALVSHHAPGFVSLDQAAFRAMGAAFRARKKSQGK